jgi:TetR/AcrR family transcriptional repressor of nem operon
MRDPQSTKSLIVSKSISLFNKKGYRATSLSDITTATGMTKGAIYGNFENKDAVALAAFEFAILRIIEELNTQIKGAKNAPDKLKSILYYYEKYIENPPIEGGCPIINTSVEADDEFPELRMKAIRIIGMIKASLVKIINRGIIEGQLRKGIDAELYATMFYATIQGAILMSRVEGHGNAYAQIKKGLLMQIDAISL